MKKFRTVYYEIGDKTAKNHLIFAHLSDLHGSCYGEGQRGLLTAIREIRPHGIMVTGDMIAMKKEANRATLNFLRALTKDYPVFFCNGNHETRYRETEGGYQSIYRHFIGALKSMGVIWLNNRSTVWDIEGKRFQVAGFEGELSYYGRFTRKKPTKEDLTRALGKKDKTMPTILLAHNSMCFPSYAAWGADLTFSGHLHGGYLRLPCLGGIISPQFEFFPKYDRGLFEENGHYLCVSAGLGDHTISPRFLNPAEIPVMTLHC